MKSKSCELKCFLKDNKYCITVNRIYIILKNIVFLKNSLFLFWYILKISCYCEEDKSLFIASVFHECKNTQDLASFILNWISIGFWLVALIPGIRLNFLIKTTDLSAGFCLFWLSADTLSFISQIILQTQLTQIFLEGYYILTDSILTFQLFYYKKRTNLRVMQTRVRGGEIVFMIMLVIVIVSGISLYYWQNSQVIKLTRDNAVIGQGCLSTEFATGKRALAGQILSYFTIPLYPLSLISQLWSNYKNKEVEGISPVMFTCTVFGNILYGLSIMCDGIFPYMLNALIPGFMDIGLLIQYFYYSKKQNSKEQQELKEIRNRNRESLIGRESFTYRNSKAEKLVESQLDFGCQTGNSFINECKKGYEQTQSIKQFIKEIDSQQQLSQDQSQDQTVSIAIE